MLKEILKNKRIKVIGAFFILILFITVLNISFSAFTQDTNKRAANITVGNLNNYRITIDENNTDVITVTRKGLIKKNILIENLNNFDTKYEVTYKVYSDASCTNEVTNVQGLDVQYSSLTEDGVNGESLNASTKNVSLVAINDTDTTYYIKIITTGGFAYNELALTNQINTEFEEILDTVDYTDNHLNVTGTTNISESNKTPGWSESKTFKVENTGDAGYYVIKITDINNPYIYGSISYSITGDNGVTVAKDTLPLMDMPITGVIEMPKEGTHNYTITTYYNTLDENQTKDANKTFSYKVSIEGVYKKEINYIEDLVDLSNEVNGGYGYQKTWFVQTRNLDFNDSTTYKDATNTTIYGDYNEDGTIEDIKTELTNTNGKGFTPIGTKTNNLYASYDGQNHRIDNLYESRNSTTIEQGLFGRINNSTLANIILSGSVTNTNTASVAGIAMGAHGNSIIYNSQNYAYVSQTSSSNVAGGILGGIYGNVYIKNCINYGDISGSNSTGGVVGWNSGNLIIENLHNEGIVTNSLGNYIGGLLGRDNNTTNTTKIYNSYNSGDIENSDSSDASATSTGGLVGQISGEILIKNSYNTGNVTRTVVSSGTSTQTYQNIGGIGGLISHGLIEKSYNTGTITGGNRTGGIIGRKVSDAYDLVINKSYNTGNMSSGYRNSYATNLGGIIGYPEVNRGGKPYVLNSYNTGNINVSTTDSHTGGIFGRSTMIGYIINSYNAGDMSGAIYSGGIIGSVNKSINYINNVYNLGDITGNHKNGLLFIAGYNAGSSTDATTVLNAYHLNSITGSNISGIGTPITNEYMRSAAFATELNTNKNSIDLTTEYGGALADYELSDWVYDNTLGYPVLDN